MLSEIFLLAVTSVHPVDDHSFVEHLVENLGPRLQAEARHSEKVLSVTWHQDWLVTMFMRRLLSVTPGAGEYLKKFTPQIGHFKIVVDSDYNFRHRYSPWLEEVVGKMHEDFWFVGSNFYYLVDDQETLTFRWFSYLHTPNVNTWETDNDGIEELQDYVELFDRYFYSGVLSDDLVPHAARLFLLADQS